MDLMTDKDVSALLGVSVAALAQWRHRGKGPPFVREGNWIRYRRADVEAWVSARAALTAEVTPNKIREAASETGRLGGLVAQSRRTPEQRAEWGRKGAAARWAAKGASHG